MKKRSLRLYIKQNMQLLIVIVESLQLEKLSALLET